MAAYGDSYSAVQSADLAEQQGRRHAYQQSLQNAQEGFRGFRQANVDQLAVQRMADEDLWRKLNMNRLEKNDAALQTDRDRRLQLDRDYFDYQKTQGSKGDAMDRRQALARAYESADRGLIDTPEQVVELFGLEPQFAADIHSRSQAARMGIEADYEDAQHAATALNTHRKTVEKIADLEKKVASTTGNIKTLWKDQPGHEQAVYELKEEQDRLKRLGPQVQFLMEKRKDVLQRLVPSEDGQYAVSKTLKPFWIKNSNAPAGEAPMDGPLPTRRGQTSTGTTAPAPAPTATPQAAAPTAAPRTNFSSGYFARVRELMATKGLDMDSAIKQARAEGLK